MAGQHKAGSSGGILQDAIKLEGITRRWVDSINRRTFDDPDNEMLEYVAPRFRSDTCFKNLPSAESFQAHLSQVRGELEQFPEYTVNVLDLTSEARPEVGEIDIFLHVEVTGRPVGLKRQLLEICKWKRDGNKWRWFALVLMPGDGGMTPESAG